MDQVKTNDATEALTSVAKHDQVDTPTKNPIKTVAKDEAADAVAAAIGGSVSLSISCLTVNDMPASLAFYLDVLGFKLFMGVDGDRKMTATDDPAVWPSIIFAILSGTGESETASDLMLATRNSEDAIGRALGDGPLGKGMALYLKGPDPDALAATLPPHVEVLAQPQTKWYGTREVSLADPNGYTVTVGKHTDAPCPMAEQGATGGKTE
ncbi:hypothetical protein MMPV_004270 [Pyropia vietnamensis]